MTAPKLRSARDWVTHWQSRRSHTAAELRAKLERKDFTVTQVAEAMIWAARYAGQNDEAVATHAAESRQQQRYGQARIAAELEARGIAADHAQRVTQTTASDEGQRAEAALGSQLARFAGEAHKAAAWLSRRGFEEDLVRRTVEKLVGPLE